MAEPYQKSTHSSSSTSSKMTPQTSSTSTIGLPNKPRDVSYGSSLLQERLRDKKAESLRVKKRPTKGDLKYNDNLRLTQSSPVGRKESASHEKEVRRPSTSGGIGMTAKKSMGAKEMEDTLSSLHKQNFDLKLELFHRRQKQSTLEQRLEEAEVQIAEQDAQLAEQDEVQEINDQLLLELEKRDQAVEEAVSMICKLEAEIEKLKRDQSIVESFASTYTPVQNKSEQSLVSRDIRSSPPTAGHHAQLARIPSFLSDESEGVDTLRSVYQHNLQQTLSSESLPMLNEDREGMHSPGLSVLSKSSFLSVYGTTEVDDQGHDISNREDDATPSLGDQNKNMPETRTEEPRQRAATPLRRTRALSHERTAQFQSINDILGSPLQRLEKLQRSMTQSVQSFDSSTQTSVNEKRSHSVNRLPRHTLQIKPSDLKRSVTDDGLAKKHELPPTPDTISTSTLDFHQKADDMLQPHTGYTSHKEGPYTMIDRRRSTDERLNRREEFESDTQSSYTQTATDSHQDSVDPWMSMGNSPARRTSNNITRGPDLFAFGGLEDRSKYNGDSTSTRWKEAITKGWEEEPTTGSSPASNLRARRASVADGPVFNPLTAHPTNPKREERRIKFEKGIRFETPMRSVSGPTNFQSSLVHETTLSPESTRVHTSPSSRPSSTEPNVKDSIRNRFTPKIFKRSETINSFQFKQPTSIGKATRGFNEHTRFSSVEVNRIGDDKGLNVGRPRTAVESRLPVSRRRGSAFGGDGADDDDEADVGGVKAWLGIGKRRASFGFGGR